MVGWRSSLVFKDSVPMADHPDPIRFGILGCASIARKIIRAINFAPRPSVYAVAIRSVKKAKEFAESNPLAKLYGTYEELLDDPDVDAVYVPLPASTKWAIAAAKKGKHVLLEKPVKLSVYEIERIVEACDLANVQFMDGTMWIHHPRTERMKEFLSDAQLFGQLKTVYSNFSFASNDELPRHDLHVPYLEALGALGNVGWNCISALLWVADYELPKFVTALRWAVIDDAEILLSCGASLLWGDGKEATFHCSLLSHMTMTFTAVGTKGTLHVTDFFVPREEGVACFSTASGVMLNDLHTGWSEQVQVEEIIENRYSQEACMVEKFARLVARIKREGCAPEKKWPILTRKTLAVVDAVEASVDKGYEPVEIRY